MTPWHLVTATSSERFDAFMARALYDAKRGYYTRHIRGVGARGDFATSATLSPMFAKAVAGWLKEEARQQPKVRQVIEVGAGNGSLLAGVRQSLGWWQRQRFKVHIVETSPVLRELQREKLGDKVRWHDTMADALKAAEGVAFIYHNEVVDAFPVRVLQWQDETWQEVWVSIDAEGRVREELRPAEDMEALRGNFSALGLWTLPLRTGQRVELHQTVRDWLQEWAPLWKEGAMLAVDYGDEFPAVYHRRPRGTLRAYLLQQRLEGLDVYENVGRQDLTADVNFTDYRSWGGECGWTEAAHGSQAEFLAKHVTGSENRADDFIKDELGAGGAFKYVIHYPRWG